MALCPLPPPNSNKMAKKNESHQPIKEKRKRGMTADEGCQENLGKLEKWGNKKSADLSNKTWGRLWSWRSWKGEGGDEEWGLKTEGP